MCPVKNVNDVRLAHEGARSAVIVLGTGESFAALRRYVKAQPRHGGEVLAINVNLHGIALRYVIHFVDVVVGWH